MSKTWGSSNFFFKIYLALIVAKRTENVNFSKIFDKDHIVVGFLGQIPKLAKFSFLIYRPSSSHLIRLQDSLNYNFPRKSWLHVLFFFFACSQTPMKAENWTCHFVKFCNTPDCAQVLQNNKSPISWKKLSDSLGFLSYIYLSMEPTNWFCQFLQNKVLHLWAFPKHYEKSKSSNCVDFLYAGR